MKNILFYVLNNLSLILLIVGIILISTGVFAIGKVIGLIVTGIMIVAVALILAYQKGDD